MHLNSGNHIMGTSSFLLILFVPILCSNLVTNDAYALTYAIILITEGSSIQGCEETDGCYAPYLTTIEVGDTVIWANNDSATHTVTSGNPTDGPDEVFDSGLIMAGDTFAHKFESSGIFAYYDMINPWMQGIIQVYENDSNEINVDESELNIPSDESTLSTQTDSISRECSLFEFSNIVLEYKVEFAMLYQNYSKNVDFKKYLEGIDYSKSEKIVKYVQSILQSEDFAVMYFEKNLNGEEEKLMIQVSEKYLEYLLDGKNRLITYARTGYQNAKNEINSIQCSNSESLLETKDEALNELEQAKTERERLIKYYVTPIIENWEKELGIKKQSLQLEDFSTVRQTTEEQDSQKSDFVRTGQMGLKKGDWVKYQIDIVGGKGFFGTIINAVKQSYEDPDTGCTLSDFEWFKIEVTEINNKNPVFKTSNFCNDKENEIDVSLAGDDTYFYFIPVDVKVGDIVNYSVGEFKVVGIEKRTYGGKTVDVVKVSSESEKTYDNGYSRSTYTKYYEKSSGVLLEDLMSMKVVNTPLFGDDSFDMTIHAIDFNISRLSGSGSDGGCLIATATYGSELAPQVQMLREIRDNSVLGTQTGAAFMSAFNSFYYSFSPTVADWERQNPAFKEAIKLFITPMISSLSLLQFVDINTEGEMLGYGIGIILLNIGIYFTVPITLIMKIQHRRSLRIE